MKKTNRILNNQDFTLVIRTGQYFHNNTYKVYALENNLSYVRVGIAASTKLGNAVIRSTTRRKIRAICDLLIDYQQYSLDIVVIPKSTFISQDHATNKLELTKLLEKSIRVK